MCIDCQTFAHYLDADKRVLDEHGGTEIYQTSPSKITFTKGNENIKCLRLSPKGTTRWYTSCCNTPIANTISLEKDFAGVISEIIDFDKAQSTKDQAIGPVKYQIMAKYAHGVPPKGSSQGFPKTLVFKIMFKLMYGKITKNYLPNPFFDENTGLPLSEPTIVDKDKRRAIKSKILATS
jgi:hypothetical protein